MQPAKARVQNGRIVIDDPATDLPEGTELHLLPIEGDEDELDEEERAALHNSIREGIEDMEAGRTFDARQAIAALRSRS